jgi:PAS domain S-box-containing protein
MSKTRGETEEVRRTNRRQHTLFQTIIENALDVISIVDTDGIIRYESPSAERVLGYKTAELIGMNVFQLIHPDDIPDTFRSYDTMKIIDFTPEISRGPGQIMEARVRHKDGSWRVLENVAVELNIPPVRGLLINSRDITDRKNAENALHESKQMLQLVLDTIPVRVFWKDKDSNYLGCNRQLASDTEFSSPEEIIGKNDNDLVWAGQAELYRAYDREVIETGVPKLNYVQPEPRADGSTAWLRTSKVPLLDTGGEIRGVLGIYEDITESKLAEEALKESEERYRITLQSLPDAVSIMRSSDLQYLYVNDTFCKALGYTSEELMGKTPFDLNLPVTSEDHDNLHRCITGSGMESQAFKFRTKHGDILDTLTSCKPVHYGGQDSVIVVVTDVTPLKRAEEESKRLETQLYQAQKMEALGTLAGGIAHDFNNILAAIIGYAELAIYQIKSPEKVRKHLSEVLKSSKRARDLVSQILAFSRQAEEKYVPVMLGYTIKESLGMLRSVIPANIEMKSDLTAPGQVMADPTQIHQMMMNLSSNAVQAMGANGGVLEVNLEQVMVDEATAHDLDLSPGPHLRLSVCDSGHGMTPEVISRIFDPYFTTRDVGKGTGLGLSIVHGIVIRHKGAITCKSEPGRGATFEIYLPEIESGKEAVEPLAEMDLPMGTERILFIDDEPVLGVMAKKILESLGYGVTSKTSSREALDLFTEHPDRFDLVITDMAMPEITGDKLSQKMMNIRRDIPIILCTGYSEHITEEKAKKIGIREMIMKPLGMRELTETIRKVLDTKNK